MMKITDLSHCMRKTREKEREKETEQSFKNTPLSQDQLPLGLTTNTHTHTWKPKSPAFTDVPLKTRPLRALLISIFTLRHASCKQNS